MGCARNSIVWPDTAPLHSSQIFQEPSLQRAPIVTAIAPWGGPHSACYCPGTSHNRGVHCWYRADIQRHRLREYMDARASGMGPLFLNVNFSDFFRIKLLHPNDTFLNLRGRLARLGGSLLVKSLENILTGMVNAQLLA
jgi:hypothetical protein